MPAPPTPGGAGTDPAQDEQDTMTVNSTWLPAVRQGRPAVAWSTVLPLAAAMAYADGFWMLSARGAVGAIERTQAPFTSWWRESTLVIPFFVVAVLGAAVLALRWFGPAPRTPRATVATAALVVGLGSITGIAALAASSAYDYKLESEQLQFMNSMRGICVGDCLDQARQSTLGTQVKAVLLVSGFLVVTNLLLVAWVVAVKGGRLNLTSVTQHDGASEAGGGARSRARNLRVVLAAVLIGSATIHAAVVPGQLAAWTAAGVLFIVLSVAELVVAALIQVSQRRVMLIIAAAVSAVPLVLWIYSRTAGLPFGPAAGLPVAVGIPDIICCLLEIVALIIAIVLLRSADSLQRTPLAWPHVRALAVVAVIAVTALGFAATVPAWFDAANPDGQPGMTMSH